MNFLKGMRKYISELLLGRSFENTSSSVTGFSMMMSIPADDI